jgi:hypothetical protein
MRERLKQLKGKRIEIFATVARFGKKAAYKGPPMDTVLLIGLTDRLNNLLTDHLWMTVGKQLKELNLVVGERIRFVARPTTYIKGYRGPRLDVGKPCSVDYRLANPSDFVKLSQVGAQIDIGLFKP